MRFMIFMIPQVYRGNKEPDSKVAHNPEMFEKMGKFNAEMIKAGVLLFVDGLQPLTKGARIAFSGGKVQVTDGPFAEVKEVVGGYWIIQVKSKEEALNWMKRCPAQEGDILEIRQVFEMSDFPLELQKAAQP
jgi:hypothetical protein